VYLSKDNYNRSVRGAMITDRDHSPPKYNQYVLHSLKINVINNSYSSGKIVD